MQTWKNLNKKAAVVWAVVMCAAIVRGEPKTFEVDPVHSCVLFRIQHLYTMFTGRFNAFSGTITGDPADPASFQVTAEVDILSIDTANKTRETHLLSPDFFDGKRFGVARFKSTRTVPGKDDTAQVTGDLTIRDVTREVTFAVKFLGQGPDHMKGTRAGFHAETTLNRRDFGIAFAGQLPNGKPMLSDSVDLILEIEAAEKGAPAAPAKSPEEKPPEPK
jgi:polyisoprenoid-binding protein YceI